MEKRTPHTPLRRVRDLLASGQVRTTQSALVGAAALGMDFAAVICVVASLTAQHFRKSMTTHRDYRVWQDVYRVEVGLKEVYVKLTVSNDVLIVVSFKEA